MRLSARLEAVNDRIESDLQGVQIALEKLTKEVAGLRKDNKDNDTEPAAKKRNDESAKASTPVAAAAPGCHAPSATQATRIARRVPPR
jgi:hypothetical protein